MEKISGTVEEIIFYNEDNGYCVCDIDSNAVLITCVGILPYLSEGETVTFEGEYTSHPVYGKQFAVSSFIKSPPVTIDSIYKYLSSGLIKGIRSATASKIVDKFGEDALTIIETNPEKLAEIKGISLKKAYEIGNEYIKQFGMRNLAIFLQDNGISANFAGKVYKKYGGNAIDRIKKNPYILAKDIHGIGFKTSDNLAFKLGFDAADPERLKSAITFVLNENAMSSGNTFMPSDYLINKTAEMLRVDKDLISNALSSLIFEKSVISESDGNVSRIYSVPLHIAEVNAAYRLKSLNSVPPRSVDNEILKIVDKAQKLSGITLEEKQKNAVISALTCPVMVITGGPGTGKTTIINIIIKAMELKGKSVILAAPTGRAAKRMAEITGKDAKTIHRLLETGFNADGDSQVFMRNETNPIEAQVIIVDEMSMVDILLFNSLLKAIAPGTTLIMVGDSDQLPSVGPGNVLRDIIESDGIIVERLTEIFRQEEQSMIVINAHRINNGLMPNLNIKGKDFFFMPRETPEEIVNTISELCMSRLPKTYNLSPFTDIQVLTPMRKSTVGVNTLNKELQQVLNPHSEFKPERSFGETVFRINDKVMQIKNNYDIEWTQHGNIKGMGLFNGDMGIIRDIDDEYDRITVEFDDNRLAEYDFGLASELEMCYATTIHKSQGSEFPVVIMPLFKSPPSLMCRNLLYTAVTRAKKLVILVGNKLILEQMIKNNSEIKRFSGLKERLMYQ